MNEHKRILQLLADQAAERLDEAQEKKMQAHLEQCDACREQARLFKNSYSVLAGAFQDVAVPSLAVSVLNRTEHSRPASPEFSWRSAWAGAAALGLVFFFSVWMVRPMLSDQQVLADYGQDIQTLWEGGGADVSSVWIQDSWDEQDWVENLESDTSEASLQAI